MSDNYRDNEEAEELDSEEQEETSAFDDTPHVSKS